MSKAFSVAASVFCAAAELIVQQTICMTVFSDVTLNHQRIHEPVIPYGISIDAIQGDTGDWGNMARNELSN